MEVKKKLIQEIINVCAQNNVPTTGDLFFSLAFCSESQLRAMSDDLYINHSKI